MGKLRAVLQWGVGRRLVALVLLPLVVLAFVATQLALDRRSSADAAADVAHGVEQLRVLVDLQSSLYNERAVSELVIRAAQLGIAPEQAFELLGFDEAVLTSNAGRTDELVAQLPDLDIDLVVLAAARTDTAAGDDQAIATYDDLDGTIVRALLSEIDVMSANAVATADPEVDQALGILADSVVAFSSGADQVTRLSGTWFGNGADQAGARSQLGLTTARYELAIDRLEASGADLDALGSIGSIEESTSPYDAAVLAGLRGELSLVDAITRIDEVAEAFNVGFNRNVALGNLVSGAATRAEEQAGRVSSQAETDYRMAIALGLGAVALTLALSLWLARSIGRPLRVLTERMRQVGAGRIDGHELVPSGPPEIAEAAGALNDVMANLHLLERKVDALASCNFDDLALFEPLPGALGKSLAASVEVLSGSILDRTELQEKLTHQANHDSLTGLANRPAALERLRSALARTRRHRRGLALLFIDLDGFKRSNDLYGHAAGDLVLVEVGRRLARSVRGIDLAARLGGDEFVVILEEIEHVEEGARLAQRVRQDLILPIRLPEGEVTVGASIGIAHTSNGDVEALDLLTAADVALYRAKNDDERIVVFDENLRDDVERRSQIERRLRQALETGDELELHYQPLIDGRTGEVRGVEALTRWTAAVPVSPAVFVPVAERSDLIIDLDRWVLRTAMTTAAQWHRHPAAADLRVSVNISGRHLVHADFVDHVLGALDASGLAPQRLVIEVTETALVIDQARAAAHLAALRTRGVGVAVDDFGTGFTSISQLRELPVDELKIDRSLVMSLPHGNDREMVRMVMELADHLGIPTVGEGVETPEQAEFLAHLGCDLLQGWLYAPAMPAIDLLLWLTARARNQRPEASGPARASATLG